MARYSGGAVTVGGTESESSPGTVSPRLAAAGRKADVPGLETPADAFRRFYDEPLRALTGNSGWLALIVSCALYERFVRAVTRAKPTQPRGTERIAHDFRLTKEDANVFWNCIRNGLLHHGMPGRDQRAKQVEYSLSSDHQQAVEFRTIDGLRTICINPWRVRDQVLDLVANEPAALEFIRYPLARVVR